ncbi:MAG TPA: dienelactone hydrolase family protein [Acidimicrobiales bacterium]|nr:dienelactone hydrolase family protein [Acidimicrobiales bacterium]
MRRGWRRRSLGEGTPWRGLIAGVVIAGAVTLAVVLIPSSGNVAVNVEPPPGPYDLPGPFAAGVTTLNLAGGPVDVWYPIDHGSTAGATRASYDLRDWLPAALAARVPARLGAFTTDAYRDATPATGGPFPLVLFASGLYSFRDQSTFLTSWLASWGFVVASPEFSTDLTKFFRDLGDSNSANRTSDYQVLVDTETLVLHDSATGTGLLANLVRPGMVGIVGHSLGGLDAIQFAGRSDVAVYVSLAGGSVPPPADMPAKPSLFMTGSADQDVKPAWVKATYDAAPSPKKFVSLPTAGHLAFTDLCLINPGHGGVAAIGAALNMRLPAGAPFVGRAVDGCGPGNLAPSAGFAVIRQDVTAELKTYLSAGH